MPIKFRVLLSRSPACAVPLGLGTKVVHKELLLQMCSLFVSNRSRNNNCCCCLIPNQLLGPCHALQALLAASRGGNPANVTAPAPPGHGYCSASCQADRLWRVVWS